MAIVLPSKTMKTRPSQSTSRTETTPGESQSGEGADGHSAASTPRKAVDQQAERVPVVYCAEPRRWPWHPGAVSSNVILSVSILPVSIPTLLVFPLRMRQSDLFISSTSPLTSFTVPGTGALMPRYRYVTPPPSPCACVNPIPSLLLLPPPPFTCFTVPGTGAPMSCCLGTGV